MRECNECRNFIKNPMNIDGKCEVNEIQCSAEQECCPKFKEKLNNKQLTILELYKKRRISRTEYKNYCESKKQVVNELIDNGCITGKGIANPANYYIIESEFKKQYSKIIL